MNKHKEHKHMERGAESGEMPKGRRHPDHSGEAVHHRLGGSESGRMPGGRKYPDRSGDQVKPWKHDGEM
jgi:hypothetical protein